VDPERGDTGSATVVTPPDKLVEIRTKVKNPACWVTHEDRPMQSMGRWRILSPLWTAL
jgi:hypothetical protein